MQSILPSEICQILRVADSVHNPTTADVCLLLTRTIYTFSKIRLHCGVDMIKVALSSKSL